MKNQCFQQNLFESSVKRFLLFILIVIVMFANLQADWNWSGRAGLNYDYISHDYYLATIDTLNLTTDSLLELKTYSDRIDEKGAFLRFDMTRQANVTLRISNRSYFTNERIRNVTNLRMYWGILKLSTNAEIKSYGDTTEFSLYKRHLLNSSRVSLKLFKSDKNMLEVSQEVEYSDYQNPNPLLSGYWQHESRLRYNRIFNNYSNLDFNLRYDRREAIDSTMLNFNRLTTDINFSRISSLKYFSLDFYLERKEYTLTNSGDDYTYFAPALRYYHGFNDNFTLQSRLELQYYSYDLEDFATFSNNHFNANLKLKYYYNLLSSFSIGLGMESYEASDNQYSDQDYNSFKLLAGYETLASSWFSITLDSEVGWRNYQSTANEFYTDFHFVEFDLLADIQITNKLRLSTIGGIDFEYHDSKEDDFFVYLLSTSLTYSIK